MKKEQQVELMNDILAYEDRIQIYLPTMISLYRKADISEASNQMADLSEGLFWLTHSLKLIKGEDSSFIGALKEMYKELLDALENQDYTLVADILEYELLEQMKNVREEIQKQLSMSLN